MKLKTAYLFSFFLSVLLAGCTNMSDQGLKSRTVEDYYVTTGVEKYFLTDIPLWANFDQAAACYRPTSIRYFNIEALMKSYGLDYAKAIQVQASYNEELNAFKGNLQNHIPTLKEEELLFYKVSDKVGSKIIFFDPPTFKRINIVWLDEVLDDAKKEMKLKKFLHSAVMDEGVPVIMSYCLTRDEVEKRFPDINTKMITAEMLSVYSSTGERSPGFQIELNKFFGPSQKLYFYSQQLLQKNDQLKGLFKISNY
jgi:hypothetical protein